MVHVKVQVDKVKQKKKVDKYIFIYTAYTRYRVKITEKYLFFYRFEIYTIVTSWAVSFCTRTFFVFVSSSNICFLV